jgi:hypothetical protein
VRGGVIGWARHGTQTMPCVKPTLGCLGGGLRILPANKHTLTALLPACYLPAPCVLKRDFGCS